MVDYNDQKSKAIKYYENFKKELDLEISSKYKDKSFYKIEPRFILSIQEFLEAINDFFFSQYLSCTLMCRSALESSIQLAIIWFYKKELYYSRTGKKDLNDFLLIIKNMKNFYKNISSFDKNCKIVERLSILSEKDLEEIKILRERSNFVAHRTERIFNGPSNLNEYNKDFKGLNQILNEITEKAMNVSLKAAIESSKEPLNIKMDIEPEEAKSTLDITKKYIIKIISNSIYDYF